jgi:thiamine kinase-like enzyme
LAAALTELELPGAKLVEWLSPYAMSMQTGLDADSAFIECDGARYVLKLHHGELPGADNPALAADAARNAAQIGIAPAVIAYAPDTAATLFERAPADWRTVMRPDFDDPGVRLAALGALKRWHGTDPLPTSRPAWHFVDATVTALDAFIARREEGARIVAPEDYEELRSHYAALLSVIGTSPMNPVPLHGEILASNMLVGPDKQIMLIDFDHVANGDPIWDLAALALAFDTPDAEHGELLVQYGVTATGDALARLHACMALQDIGWGLWGRLAHFLSPRSSIEFFKYGETRLVRARARLAAEAGAQL